MPTTQSVCGMRWATMSMTGERVCHEITRCWPSAKLVPKMMSRKCSGSTTKNCQIHRPKRMYMGSPRPSASRIFAHLGRDRERHLRHRIAGGEFEEQEDHERDEEKRRDRKDQPADRVLEHERRLVGEGRGPNGTRPGGEGRGASVSGHQPSMRNQSATFHSSLSQVFSWTPPRVLACADTRPRSTSGMMA